MITQDSLGWAMVTLARELYAKLPPTAPFCVSEFDLDEKTVEKFKGKGGRYDAEERMCKKMPELIQQFRESHGGADPKILVILSRWTPCERICSSAIYGLAARFPHFERIHVYFMEVYAGDVPQGTVTAMDRMNTVVSEQIGAMRSASYTKIVCEPLQKRFLQGVVPARAQEQSKKNFQKAVHAKLKRYGFFD